MPDITAIADRLEERVDTETLRIKRRSMLSGEVHTMDLCITAGEWASHLSGSLLVQDALPRLTDSEREFLLTGSTPAEWDAAFRLNTYAIEPQRDVFKGTPEGADGSTWFEVCHEADAEIWTVFDTTEALGAGPTLIEDFPSRAEAEAFVADMGEDA